MRKNNDLSIWIEGALMIAVAQIMSYLPTGIGFYNASIGVIPIILFAFRHGTAKGCLVGLVYGLLKIVLGDLLGLEVIQVMIEYSIPYLSLGVAGLFASTISSRMHQQESALGSIILGVVTACIARYIWHYIAGVVYWGHYAPEGQSPYIYSLLINGGSMLLTIIAASIVLSLLYTKSPRLFKVRH